MIFVIENGTWEKTDSNIVSSAGQHVCIMCVDEIEQHDCIAPLDKVIIKDCLRRKAFTFEHQDKRDYIGVLFLNTSNLNETGEKFCICAETNLLTFIYENTDQSNSIAGEIVEELVDGQTCISDVFISFMKKTIIEHIEQHELIEDEIAALENSFLTDKKNLGPSRILVLQKKLLVYKRYYEQLQHGLEEIRETKHGLIDEGNMRLFTLYTRRIERLFRNVLVLREYVTQVRESYEAETDISLNSIMRLFTVVTVIFLPLTLIVGWYGMNLQMPEYQWIWSYPLVIIASLIIVVFTIMIFKKNKWF